MTNDLLNQERARRIHAEAERDRAAANDLMYPAQAARRIGVAPVTLARWRWSGDGPRFVKIGRAVRYDPEDLERYIAERRRNSTSDPGPGAV